MTFLFPLAFAAAFVATHRSVGWGILTVVGVGYFNGLVRAHFLSVYTTFTFDAALLGLYLAFFLGRGREGMAVWGGVAGHFVLVLIAWPTLLSLMPINDSLVQLVALRATVWFLPVLLIATRLTVGDLTTLARGLAALNVVALGFGLYVYVFGLAALYPYNAVTALMYRAVDVGDERAIRVPSTFLSGHAYGGTMLMTLPWLFNQTFGRGVRSSDRSWAVLGMAAAVGGMLLCAARLPIVLFGVAAAVVWACSRFSPRIALGAMTVVTAGAVLALSDERLQRAATLGDLDVVTARVRTSANDQFLDLLGRYPVGAGMGSSVGTSIPYFLADRAPEPIGMENEFSRILVDQGVVGLFGWLAFLSWLLLRPPRPSFAIFWQLGVLAMYGLLVASWGTAFIGAGLLSAVPGSVLMLTQMGVLVAVREVGAVPGALPSRPLRAARPQLVGER